jgi:ribonuclease HII
MRVRRLSTRANPRLTAGVDEAGRGPLAGPVYAAAVVLPPGVHVRGLRDSKQLTPQERERLVPRIERAAISWAVAWSDVAEIDQVNILQATLLAMRRALDRLPLWPAHVQVDGCCLPVIRGASAEAIVDGDCKVAAISAASILAKVYRDEEMRRLHALYPEYGFAEHKGYATLAHLTALARLGPSPIHRESFAPVRESLQGQFWPPHLVPATLQP